MSFAHAKLLLLLLLLIPFAGLIVYNFRKKRALLAQFMSETAFAQHGVRSLPETDFFKSALLITALVCFIVALAGPQWGERYESTNIKGLEITFLLDTSASMSAEDLRPSRLEVAKELVATVVDRLKTDYVALINFAGFAYVQCPLTMDYEAFKLMASASTLSPGEEQGTDFAKAFALAMRSFKGARTSQKLVILITDGEDQEGQWQDQMAELKKHNVVVFTVGVGAGSGAPIPVRNAQGEIVDWKKDKSSQMVKTSLNEESLIRIASENRGQYFRLTDAAGVEKFVSVLQSFSRTYLLQKVRSKKVERFHYPLLLGIIALLAEMALSERRLSWRKK
jgi:Ca-activated chloride channel homolog